MLRVRDVMTRETISVEPWTPLREVAALLAARHVSGVPVVDRGRLLGVVSSTDLLGAAGAIDEPEAAEDDEEGDGPEPWREGDDPPASYFVDAWERTAGEATPPAEHPSAPPGTPWERPVEDVMTRDVLTVRPDAPIEAAAALMRRAGVHRLLVVDGGRLAGVISAMDVVRAVAEHRVGTRALLFNADWRFDTRGWSRSALRGCDAYRPSGEHRR